MRVAIHQPYFLPWLGYFAKLAFADVFVVLDDVQFRKRHFIDRTRIVDMHGEVRWIGLPVGENFGAECREVRIRDIGFLPSLLSTIAHSYAKGRHFDDEFGPVQSMLLSSIRAGQTIVDVNVSIVKQMAVHLQLPLPEIVYSSHFVTAFDATERIIALCDALNARELLVGAGKSGAVHDWRRVRAEGIHVMVQDYLSVHPVYSQTRRRVLDFSPGLSVIDSLFNVGRRATEEFIRHETAVPKAADWSESV